jgi:thiol:disulfide interchange protein DsbD
MNKLLLPLLAVLVSLLQPALAQEQNFLPPEQAFAASATQGDAHTLQLKWKIADGYYMYRDRLKLHVDGNGRTPALTLPAAESKFDPNFGATMQVYHRQLQGAVDWAGEPPKSVTIEYQGCAEGGLCYPPQFLHLDAAPGGAPQLRPVDEPLPAEQQVVQASPVPAAASASDGPRTTRAAPATAAAAPDAFSTTLAGGNLLKTAVVFWIGGLLLSLTPCVLPMVPILSTLIAGQGAGTGRKRGFWLSLSYVLGMALVYAALGVAAGLAGQGLAAALQNPWVLASFATVLAVLSLSMFGVYELQMPARIQERVIGWSNRIGGGAVVPVFVMGGLSALVVGPCVAAPLAGALIYISQSHDVVVGGVALLFLALGMGVPLLVVGASADMLLPRAGAWMESVKHVFGVVLLGTALWIVSPVLQVQVQMLLWALVALVGALVLGGVQPRNQPAPIRIIGLACTAVAAALFVGAASGGTSVLQPLAHLQPVSAPAGQQTPARDALQVRTVSSDALDRELAALGSEHRPAMIDLYADWCVACKEFEEFTFSNPGVRSRLQRGGVQVLRVDVTANSESDRQLLKRFTLFGPPAVIFAAGPGGKQVLHKVVGFEDAAAFQVSLDKASIPQ